MPAEWSLVITQRDGTAVYTFTSDDAADLFPVAAFEGQDTRNDIAISHLTLPAEHAANDYLTEDNLVHLYVRGSYVTSYMVRVPDVGVIDPQGEASEFAVYTLSHVLCCTEEGIVEPPLGMDTNPASPDRAFNFASPEFDDTGWSASTELAEFLISSPPTDFPVGSTAVTVWSQDYDLTGGFHNHPEGVSYFRDTLVLGGTDDRQVRFWLVVDDHWEFWFAGIRLDSYAGTGPSAKNQTHQFELKVSPGSYTVAVKGINTPNPGFPNNVGTVVFSAWTMAGEIPDTELLASSAATLCVDYPAIPPGFNRGQIILNTLAEEQALGAMTDVICSFSDTLDSDGNAWDDPVDVSTKSTTGFEQFWVKELTATLCDIDAHWDGANIVIDAWNKGAHQTSSGLTLTEGVNLGQLSVPGAPSIMSSAAVTWSDGGDLAFTTIDQAPISGHPVRRRGFSLGADSSLEQVTRDATSQLDQFNRPRSKPTLTHLTNPATADADMPPNWWKWNTIDVTVTSRWLTSGTLDLIGVTFRLTENGLLEFTPEAGDLIIPTAARAGVTLRKMAPPNLGGQARNATAR